MTKDIPAYAVVAGNPAHIIKYRFDKEYIDELLKIDFSKIDKNIVKYNEKLFFDEVGDYKKLRILPQKGMCKIKKKVYGYVNKEQCR